MAINKAKLVELRLRNGWSQAETARQGGFGQSHYSMIERGARNPNAANLLRLANLFEVDVTELAEEAS